MLKFVFLEIIVECLTDGSEISSTAHESLGKTIVVQGRYFDVLTPFRSMDKSIVTHIYSHMVNPVFRVREENQITVSQFVSGDFLADFELFSRCARYIDTAKVVYGPRETA